ncbi:hypothetical protein LCGC14_3154350 [marine sediment metagenome]|uniref:Uncharacterized protein n=1 Tax=marine sediment metagenome TaxID=412755 RepID=A0A0F8WH70_9ZZZZ
MARFKTRRQNRFTFLRDNQFLPLEARLLSKLPKVTPALKLMVLDRLERRVRFEKIAARKIETGKWKRGEIPKKWIKNISRMYGRMGLRVKEGPRGKQQKLAKRTPNPWALYRKFVRQAPGKRHVSPWELRQVHKGKTTLARGLVFVQKTEKAGSISKRQLRQFITEKRVSVADARGQRKAQLKIELTRLEKLL